MRMSSLEGAKNTNFYLPMEGVFVRAEISLFGRHKHNATLIRRIRKRMEEEKNKNKKRPFFGMLRRRGHKFRSMINLQSLHRHRRRCKSFLRSAVEYVSPISRTFFSFS